LFPTFVQASGFPLPLWERDADTGGASCPGLGEGCRNTQPLSANAAEETARTEARPCMGQNQGQRGGGDAVDATGLAQRAGRMALSFCTASVDRPLTLP